MTARHLTILAVGSRGDVQPFVALGRGLRRAGYRVRLATHAPFERFVISHDLDFTPLGGDPRAMVEHEGGRMWVASGRNPIRFFARLRRLVDSMIDRFLADCLQACQDTEAIVFSLLGIAGYHIAEHLNVPRVYALLQPLTATRSFPHLLSPRLPDLGGAFNRLTYSLIDQMTWQPYRTRINRWRRKVLGLKPLPFLGPYRIIALEGLPTIYGFSPRVVPRPADWPDWHHVTGYWFLDQPEGPDADLGPDLRRFIEDGSQPVYAGFGSMVGQDPGRFTRIILDALELTKERGVLLTGWGGLAPADIPRSVFVADSAPHERLFPLMKALVHHGGAGTTAAGIRAGVPAAVVPFFADQPFWARRVAALGLGPEPIPQRSLTPERLAEAIRQTVEDGQMRARAATLGAGVRAESGVDRAVEVIRRYTGG